MNIVELIAVIFSLLSVILTIKNNIWCWPVGIIGIVFYSILFYQYNIWGNMCLQGIFIGQSILGWYSWNKPKKYPIKWIEKNNRTTVFGLTALLAVLVYSLTRNAGGQMPYFDGLTTSLSIVAMILMTYRKIDNWLFWIWADIIFIGFFYSTSMYLSTGIYFIFLLLSISGLLQWKMSLKEG